MRKFVILLPVFITLAACGTQGSLKTAPPMWGDARQKYEEQKAQEAQKSGENQTNQIAPH